MFDEQKVRLGSAAPVEPYRESGSEGSDEHSTSRRGFYRLVPFPAAHQRWGGGLRANAWMPLDWFRLFCFAGRCAVHVPRWSL